MEKPLSEYTREELIELLKDSSQDTIAIRIELHNRAMQVRGNTHIPQFET